MPKKSHVKYEKGLTLIEVLASLVILGIVFIGFMNIFPQMTVFNKKTETKLDTMNLAKQEIVDIKSHEFIAPLTFEQIEDFNSEAIEISGADSPVIKIKYQKKGYRYEVKINKENALIEENAQVGQKANNIGLYKVHVQIFTDVDQLNSETYGYLEIVNQEVADAGN